MNVALVVLNSTDVAPQRFVPVMTTIVARRGRSVGENDVIVGAAAAVTREVDRAAGVRVPSAFVTMTSPCRSSQPHGTVVVIEVSLDDGERRGRPVERDRGRRPVR